MKLRTSLAIGLPCAYLLAIGAMTARVAQKRSAAEARVSELARVGDRAGAELRDLPDDLEPLEIACRGLVETGTPADVVAYAAPYPLELDGQKDLGVGQPPVYLPRRRFDGMSTTGLERTRVDDPDYEPLTSVFFELALEAPWSWSERVDRRGNRSLRLEEPRYLVVSVVRSIEPVELVGQKGFVGGRASLLARVIDTGDSSTVCEGRVEASIASAVLARGKVTGNRLLDATTLAYVEAPSAVGFAFTRAIELAPLSAVCDAGGPTTCTALEQALKPPAWPAQGR